MSRRRVDPEPVLPPDQCLRPSPRSVGFHENGTAIPRNEVSSLIDLSSLVAKTNFPKPDEPT